MDIQKAQELLDKHRAGTLTPDEKAMLDRWYLEVEANQPEAAPDADLIDKQKAVFARIQESIQPKTIRLWPRIAAAASILLVCSAGLYFYEHSKPKADQTTTIAKTDIKPGHNQATLTLANGQKIILTKGLSGTIATQGNTSIQASQQNIVYAAAPNSENQISYNTLSTAKGEQSPYPLVLADGTKAWLNAESSITFPVAFVGKERSVTVTGEVYFEVVHNEKMPFKVKTANQSIEDIGTHFNVNAYNDEPATITTLLEGAVKVNNHLLKPGQQSDGTNITAANTDAVMAWRNGYFQFDDEHIQPIMRRIARWYNVDVVYTDNAPTDKFYGYVPRFSNASQVLKKLELTNKVHFKIEGRRIMVSR